MRTNIVIDEQLMAEAMQATDTKTKRELFEEALRTVIRLRNQAEIRKLRGGASSHRGKVILEAMCLD